MAVIIARRWRVAGGCDEVGNCAFWGGIWIEVVFEEDLIKSGVLWLER